MTDNEYKKYLKVLRPIIKGRTREISHISGISTGTVSRQITGNGRSKHSRHNKSIIGACIVIAKRLKGELEYADQMGCLEMPNGSAVEK